VEKNKIKNSTALLFILYKKADMCAKILRTLCDSSRRHHTTLKLFSSQLYSTF